MPKLARHVQKTPGRTYFGQEVADPLVTWLNFTEDAEGRDRIIRLMELLGRFDELRTVEAEFPNKRRGKTNALGDHHKTVLSLGAQINHILEFYQTVNAFDLILHEGSPSADAYIVQRPAPGSALASHARKFNVDSNGLAKEAYSLPGPEMSEVAALNYVLHLWAHRHQLASVQKCTCGRYYFKKFSHQRYCGDACRTQAAKSDPEQKKKRAEYQRKLYHLHKSGKVR